MNSTRIPITPQGFQALLTRLTQLKKQEAEIALVIGAAAALGDRSENAEYHAAKHRQNDIQSNIDRIETRVAVMEIIDPLKFGDQKTICFGAWVVLQNEEDRLATPTVYQIVGEDEAALEQGKLSIFAPLARAILGKNMNDHIQFVTPLGDEKMFRILNFGFGSLPCGVSP